MKIFLIVFICGFIGTNAQISSLLNLLGGSGSNNPLSNLINNDTNTVLNNIGNLINGNLNNIGNTLLNLLNNGGGSNNQLNNITNTVVAGLNQTSNILNTIQNLLNGGSSGLINNIGSLISPNTIATLSTLLTPSNIALLQQELQTMINSILNQPLPQIPQATSIANAIKIFQSIVQNLPQLKQNLTGVNNINVATSIISNFIQKNVDPSINIQATLTQYYQLIAPTIYASIKYSTSVENLFQNLMVYFGGNATVTDPNFFFNILSLVLSSGVSDYNSLLHPATNIPTGIPDVTISNFNFGMLIPGSSLLPLSNDPVIMNHIQTYVPSLIFMLLNASKPNDVIQIVENTIYAHITPAVLNATINDIQKINPSLYQQIKGITDPRTLFEYIKTYLISLVINQLQTVASTLGINLYALLNIPTTTNPNGVTSPSPINLLQTAATNLILATYSDYMTYPYKSNADKLTTFQNNFQLYFSNPQILSSLKLYLLTISPPAYLAVINSNDASSFLNNIKSYYPIIGSLLYTGANQIPGFMVPNDLFAFLGYTASTTVPTATITKPSLGTLTSFMQTLAPFYNTAIQNIFAQLLTSLSSAGTPSAQIIAINNAILNNFNTPQLVALIISKMQTINPSVYAQISGFTTINQLLPYIQPYYSQLFLADLTTFSNNNNYPTSVIIPALQNLFGLIASNASSSSAPNTSVSSFSTVTLVTFTTVKPLTSIVTTPMTSVVMSTLAPFYNTAIQITFTQLLTSLSSAGTPSAQIIAINNAILNNFNTPQLVALIISKMQTINPSVYAQISGFTTINQLLPYIQPYYSQLFLADLTTFSNNNNYPTSIIIPALQNLFGLIASNATLPTTLIQTTTLPSTTTTNLLQNILNQINQLTTTAGTTPPRVTLKPFLG